MTKNSLNLEITKSGTPHTYTFQNSDGTLAHLTDITGTNSGTNTGDETASRIGVLINGSTTATPNDTDLVATAESSLLKKITWANVKAFLKTYFDTLYPTTGASVRTLLGITTLSGSNTGDETTATIKTKLSMSTAGALLVSEVAPVPLYNQSLAQQGAGFATDTYLTGSSIAIPNGSLQAGARYKLVFDVSKTAAGTATPIIRIRIGTNGTTADTALLTFTFLAQTAAADIGTFEFWVTFRSVGSGISAVIQGCGQVRHRLQITGLQNLVSTTLQVTSGGFDSTVSNLIIGASVNGGTSASWTVQMVQAELNNLQ